MTSVVLWFQRRLTAAQDPAFGTWEALLLGLNSL